jgi:hypothetical protein
MVGSFSEGGAVSDRFTVLPYSRSAHCCFEATVVDTKTEEELCECFEQADADRIAAALNATVTD